MLALDGVTLRLSGRIILNDVSLTLIRDSRVALVGANGAGKTSLLRMLAGVHTPELGKFTAARELRIGYLPQEAGSFPEYTLWEFVRRGASERVALEEEMRRQEDAMHHGDESAIEAYGRAAERFEAEGGYSLDVEVAEVLTGLQFPEEGWQRPVAELSGGWRLRAHLASLLVRKPNLLLLDEPTNHLDLQAIVWLEAWLKSSDAAFMLVSHDHRFLDALSNETLEVSGGHVERYAGNYSFYLQERGARKAQIIAAAAQQDREIRHIQEFVDRFRYNASKASQVQSRIKMLDKIERIEAPHDQATVRLRLPEAPRASREVATLLEAEFGYGEKSVFHNLDFYAKPGDRAALVGRNGAGKSTLLKLLSGELSPQGGVRRIGHNTRMAYFAQHVAETMDPNKNLLEEMALVHPHSPPQQLRTWLGGFLFTGDDVEKKIRVLSGGEKTRLALAKLLTSPVNFLLLDEPTNHLDMASKEILCETLAGFGGTIVFVSHDRKFIDGLATRLIEIEHGRLSEYPGNYSEYLARKEGRALAAPPPGKPKTAVADAAPKPTNGAHADGCRCARCEAARRAVSRAAETSPESPDPMAAHAGKIIRRAQPNPIAVKASARAAEQTMSRLIEIEGLLSDPSVSTDAPKIRELSEEYRRLEGDLNRT